LAGGRIDRPNRCWASPLLNYGRVADFSRHPSLQRAHDSGGGATQGPSCEGGQRGRHRYPITPGWNIDWQKNLSIRPLRPAVAMISKAELRFRGIKWKPNQRLLVGVLRPPEYSDDFTIRAAILIGSRPGGGADKVRLQDDYPSNDPFLYVLFPPATRYSGEAVLRIELLPEPGGGDADWAFLSPIALVRATSTAEVNDCLHR